MARLAIEGAWKRFGSVVAVEAVDLAVEDGELVCLLGPSGSGKSTLLRMVGGFERPSAGAIRIDGEDVAGLPPERRPTGMVFQSHALWSHMDVAGNIAFGLRLRRLTRTEIAARVSSILELVGLEGLGGRRTSQLSGGQQQRVALARSLVLEPKILLLDEPFASLDQHLRERLREEVRGIQRRLGITTLFVTHGQDEALSIADRVVVMNQGRVEQVGAPGAIYADPATEFVAGFIGAMNLVAGRADGREVVAGPFRIDAALPPQALRLAVRPEDLRLRDGHGAVRARVVRVVEFGSHRRVEVEAEGGTLLRLEVRRDADVAEGEIVPVSLGRFLLFGEAGRIVVPPLPERVPAL